MTATATPRKRSRKGRRIALIVGGLLVALIAIIVALQALSPRGPAPGSLPEGWQSVAATSGSIAATVSATGNVEPQAQAELRFEANGTVAELMVEAGEKVRQGQPLARINTAGLQLQVEQAQADLRQAQADLEALIAGASPQDIAEAKARIEQARRQYAQSASTVSPADINAARADLEAAKARLARLEAGPAKDELATANQQVQSAQTGLDNARVNLSAAKEQARLDMETRANALRNVQDEYSRVYWQNRELDTLPGDLPQERKDMEVKAQRAVDDATTALENAQRAYEQAKQDEINTLAAREADLKAAQATRDKVLKGAKSEELADARAAIQRAQANLTKLTGSQRQSELAAQASNIDIAQANLNKLLADPTTNALASRQAAVARAETSVKSAQRNLDLGTLTAPFDATIARVSMRVGEPSSGTSAVINVVDLRSFHINLPVDELDIAHVEHGQRVKIELDAIAEKVFGGAVTNIAPLATRSSTGTTTYEVTVTLDQNSPGVRPGMTAVVEIVTTEKKDVVLVPRRAVRSEGGKSFVLVPTPDLPPPVAAPGQTVTPGQRREVVIGLTNSESVEIVSGLTAGEQVLVQNVVSTFNPSGRPN